jgi:hypothetical protein
MAPPQPAKADAGHKSAAKKRPAAAESPSPSQVAHGQHRESVATKKSEVVRKRQLATLEAMFRCITSRFLFAVSPQIQHKVATSLTGRFRVFLHHSDDADASGGGQGPPMTARALRDRQLEQLIPVVVALVLESMDELGLRERITDLAAN